MSFPYVITRTSRVWGSPDSDPTTAENEAAGFRLTDRWLRTDTGALFRCVNAAAGTWAAVPSPSVAASETASGIAELATQAEVDAVTDDLRIVTPLKLGATAARRLRETGGPTILTLGAVADGQVLTRSGSTLVGSAPGGGTPSVSVVTETAFGQASAVGVATAYSRGDHTHGTPVAPTAASVGAVPTGRVLTTTAPLTIGGGASADLSADRTLAVAAATTTAVGVVELATDGEAIADRAVQGNDTRLSNARTPTAHAASHQDGGSDEISVTALSGQLADAQKVTVRKNSGPDVGTRARLNLIEGSNVTLTVTDDAGSGEVDVTIAAAAGGSGNAGTATLDFGAFPGTSYTEVVVTGQAWVVAASSIVQAWLRHTATADHTADEHVVESIRVGVKDLVTGVGFTIYAVDSEPNSEPVTAPHSGQGWFFASATTLGEKRAAPGRIPDPGGQLRRIHGTWSCAWRGS